MANPSLQSLKMASFASPHVKTSCTSTIEYITTASLSLLFTYKICYKEVHKPSTSYGTKRSTICWHWCGSTTKRSARLAALTETQRFIRRYQLSYCFFGQTIILIHDADAAIELLDKRGAKYSSRPQLVFAGRI